MTAAVGIQTAAFQRLGATPRVRHQLRSVSARQLTKWFAVRRGFHDLVRHPFSPQQTPVLDSIDLDVLDGEMFGVLGVNGAGKTTLLKILSTLVLPDSGTATVAGFSILENPRAVRARLAMVTADERSLHWRLSARENILLFAGLHRMSPRQSGDRTAEVLAAVNLESADKKMVGAFSSGMRQRLLLARALLSNPRILLLDEPTRSLDPIAAHDFRDLLRSLADERGVTVILATHNPEEAFTYCDRVAVLHHHKIAALGRARDLALRFGQDRYHIWTPTPQHPCFNTLLRRGLLDGLVRRDDREGEIVVECTIAGDDEQAAEVLRRLVESHVAITRFERIALPLPELITHIVAASTGLPEECPQNA